MAKRRVVLTGIGLASPYGPGIEPFWSGLMERRSAIRPAEGFDPAEFDFPVNHLGQIPALDLDRWLDPKTSALWSRLTGIGVVSAHEALRDAGLEPAPGSLPRDRTGVILGTGFGCMYELEETYRTWFDRGWKRSKPVTVPKLMANAPASHVSIQLGLRGLNFTVATACSSGAVAAGLAAERIRSGDLDACVTGGIDAMLSPGIVAVWCALRVLSTRNDPTASRPFSADRNGLVLAEGAAVFLLEERERAQARGARIYAEIVGVGANCDAGNIVGPDEEGEELAVRAALADAGLDPAQIGYVNAHGTSTEANDANETAVLKRVFGERAYELPVSSIKGHIGHAMGAAGALDLAATALALHHQRIPPTLHWVGGDDRCDLDYVADGPRELAFEHAITNSFGFGGQNSVLALRRHG